MDLNFKYNMHQKQPEQSYRINCEYCGSFIDAATDDSCPACGASYDRNAALQQMRQQQEELKRLKMEEAKLHMAERRAKLNQQELETEKHRSERTITELENGMRIIRSFSSTRRVVRGIKKGCLIPVVLVIILIAVFLLSGIFISIQNTAEKDRNGYEQQTAPAQEPIVETPTEVRFNESADMIRYSVICDKAEAYQYPYSAPKDGFYYVRLHLVVTNKADEKLRIPGEMLCQYQKDGYKMQAEVNTIRSQDLNTRIYNILLHPDSSAEGWVYFEVPLDSDLILKYDEYVTIHIGAENCVMPEK